MPTGPVPPGRDPGEHLAVVAAEVAGMAAHLVRESIGRSTSVGTKSSPTDVVTATDLASETLIRRELLERCPGSSIRGEELADDDGANAVQWIVDPIDGTVNFLYDLPVVSVSIAASIGGTTVAGAVVDIVRGDVFTAASGHGAYRNGQLVTAGELRDLGQALTGTGFSYSAERRAEQSSILNRLLPHVRDIRCMGSAALNLCWVGCGRLDAYYEHDTKLYDYAAGALIASEGGATIELPADNELDLSIAAADAIFDPLRSIVTNH